MNSLWALLKRDLLLAWRQGGGAGTAFGFYLAVLVLLPISVGPDTPLLQRLAPGLIWITMLLSVLLSADRMFQQDFEDGSLDIMVAQGEPVELLAATKALGHWLSTSLPLAIIAPLLGFLVSIHEQQVLPLLVSTVLGSLALSFTASIGAALTLNLKRGGLLISLLVLPLYVPVLIFGLDAAAATVERGSASLLILTALAVISLVVGPAAAGAALRAHLR